MSDNRPKNICKYCGGKLIMEYIGNYGLIYAMKQDGTSSKRPLRRIMYECDGSEPMIYCSECGKFIDDTNY